MKITEDKRSDSEQSVTSALAIIPGPLSSQVTVNLAQIRAHQCLRIVE